MKLGLHLVGWLNLVFPEHFFDPARTYLTMVVLGAFTLVFYNACLHVSLRGVPEVSSESWRLRVGVTSLGDLDRIGYSDDAWHSQII